MGLMTGGCMLKKDKPVKKAPSLVDIRISSAAARSIVALYGSSGLQAVRREAHRLLDVRLDEATTGSTG